MLELEELLKEIKRMDEEAKKRDEANKPIVGIRNYKIIGEGKPTYVRVNDETGTISIGHAGEF